MPAGAVVVLFLAWRGAKKEASTARTAPAKDVEKDSPEVSAIKEKFVQARTVGLSRTLKLNDLIKECATAIRSAQP